MELKDKNLLFFTRTMGLGGTENVVLQLCEVFKPYVNKIVVCSSGGVHEKALRDMGILHYYIPDIEHKSIRNFTTVTRQLKKIIHDEDITVIHTHHRMAAFYCQLIKRRNRVKLINTSHTAFYDKKVLSHIAFNGFNLIACGEGVKNSLVNGLGFNENMITVICNGVKENLDEVYTISEIEKERNKGNGIIAAIGRLSKEKGISYLIKAFTLLNNKNISCIIVGDGPEESELKRLVKELSLADRFVFLGFRKDVANIISQVDVIVQPSLQEVLPLVPIEAFSAGKTVIGTKIDGTSEIIRDRKNGILVDPANENQLANAIDYVFSIDRKYMEAEAKSTFENKYSFEVFSKKYVDYYKHLQ